MATILAPGEGQKFFLVGDHITFKIGTKETGEKFNVADNWIAPGGGPPPHIHAREDELFYVIEGSMMFMNDKQTFVGGPGTTVYLKKNIPHTFKNVGTTPTKFLVITIPCGFEEFVAECGERVDQVPSKLQVTPQAIEKLMKVSGKYGLTILPDHKPTGEAPPRAKDRQLWVLGQLVTLKLSSKETGGTFSVAEGRSRPGQFVPPHKHVAMDELFYVIEGEYEFVIEGKKHNCPAGTLIHVPAGTMHGFRNSGSTVARLVDFHTPGGFEDFFEECGVGCDDPNTPPAPVKPDMAKLSAIFRKHGMELGV